MKKLFIIAAIMMLIPFVLSAAVDLTGETQFIGKWENGKDSIEIVKAQSGMIVKIKGSDGKEVQLPACMMNGALVVSKGSGSVYIAVLVKDAELLYDSVIWKKPAVKKTEKEKSTKEKAIEMGKDLLKK